MLEVVAGIVFGAWFLLSLAGQIWGRDSNIRRMPIGRLIPDWRFFAPEPAVDDRVVIYRRKSADEIGPVETVHFPRARALRWIWNPQNRRHKAVLDLSDGVHRLADRLNDGQQSRDLPDALVLTEPYLVLLNLVTTRLRQSASGLVQFAIIHRGWPDHEELVFLSRWHALDT